MTKTGWQNLYTRVPDTLKARLDKHCREHDISIREVVTIALEEYLEK